MLRSLPSARYTGVFQQGVTLDLCSNGLHQADQLAANGHCQGCKSLQQRRRRSASRGRPLCWRGEHDEPQEGYVCPCGQPPPPETWEDWAAVEGALTGRRMPRKLTAAEELSAMRTVSLRYGGGMFEAASWLSDNTDLDLDDRRVKFLLFEWVPRTGHVVKSTAEILDVEMNQATIPEETAA